MTRHVGVNCYKCGRWIGKDGHIDIEHDDNVGAVEAGYSMCKSCMDNKMRYREYRFTNAARLVDVVKIRKLPKNARKARSNENVWIAPRTAWGYSKVCRIDSDITFGTYIISIEKPEDE